MGDSLALGDVVRHSLQLAFSAHRALMTAFRGLSVMGNNSPVTWRNLAAILLFGR